MKIKVLFVLLVILALGFDSAHSSVKPNIDGLYKFSGKLNNKIPIFLWFVVKDSVLKGEVTYLKTAKRIPITIIGQITKDEEITVYEFTKDGSITGIYRGRFNTKSLMGNWYAPGSEKQLQFNLATKDTLLAPVDMTLKPVVVNGSYEYHFGKNGSEGGVDIKYVNADNYLIEMSCVTGAPARNLASLETFKAKMLNNTITFTAPETDCRYIIRPFNNFLVIDKITRNGECGFGMGADIDGVFIKTSEVATMGQVVR